MGNQAVHASTSSARTAYGNSIGLGEIVEEYVFSIMDSLVPKGFFSYVDLRSGYGTVGVYLSGKRLNSALEVKKC
jgi:hypothetical protein